jgi:hypothetical protein
VKARGIGKQTAFVAMVNADYEACKAEAIALKNPTRVSFTIIERRWIKHGLKPGQLLNFRANLPRKKTPVLDNWP